MPKTPHLDRLEVSTIELEEFFGVSNTTIRRYLKDGLDDLMISQKPKRIYAPTALAWYVKHEIEDKIIGRNIDSELKLARKEKLDLETARLRGELVSVEALDDSQSSLVGLLISQYRQLLLQIPHEFSDPKMKKKIRKVLDKKFKKNISELQKLLNEG